MNLTSFMLLIRANDYLMGRAGLLIAFNIISFLANSILLTQMNYSHSLKISVFLNQALLLTAGKLIVRATRV